MNNTKGYQSIQISDSDIKNMQDMQNMQNYLRQNRFNRTNENITITHNLGCCLTLYILIQFIFFICIVIFLFLKL